MSFLKRYDPENLSYDGIMLQLFQKSQLKISYSTLASEPGFSFPEAIFVDNYSIFASGTNCGKEANYYQLSFPNYLVFVEGYIFQSHSTEDNWYTRSWRVDGSLNGHDWEELHSMEDTGILDNGNSITAAINKGSYHHIRITQTGDSAGTTDYQKCRLRLQRLEFFGTAVKIQKRTICQKVLQFQKGLVLLCFYTLWGYS